MRPTGRLPLGGLERYEWPTALAAAGAVVLAGGSRDNGTIGAANR